MGLTSHVLQVLQVLPDVTLHPGRGRSKVLALGKVPVQLGT